MNHDKSDANNKNLTWHDSASPNARLLKHAKGARIIVVNDSSTYSTGDICKKYGVGTIRHLHSKESGAFIKNRYNTR